MFQDVQAVAAFSCARRALLWHRRHSGGERKIAVMSSLANISAVAAARHPINVKEMRKLILRHSKRAHVGHIGSCLCVVEILAALYGRVLRIPSPSDPDRDRFILSKGHAGLALYAALVLNGRLPESDLDQFFCDASPLGVHPDAAIAGVDFTTGSLGHGIGIATGAALAARLQGSKRRVFCLISDAECNEGSVWEAAMFAAQHRLGNLEVVIDLNGQQALGPTREIIDLSNMAQRWEAFGWKTSDVDGHSVDDLVAALSDPHSVDGAPHVVLARTVFGKGVEYMEKGVPVSQPHLSTQTVNWHYLPMSDTEYQIAVSGLEEPD
jgi:transketolase